MTQYRIKKVNKIAREGLELFGPDYSVRDDEQDPEGILVRSSRVDTDDYRSLLAVARAGAGVDSITVEKATEKGICVLNTPGANANAVAELVFVMLGISARNIHLAINFCRDLAGLSDAEVTKQVEAKRRPFAVSNLPAKPWACWGSARSGYASRTAGSSGRCG
jgi:D-3-phosphoglycerate dehydrogenase